MAGIQERNGRYRIIFRYEGKQHSINLSKTPHSEVQAKAGTIDLLLIRLKQGLVTLPSGVSIEEFMLSW